METVAGRAADLKQTDLFLHLQQTAGNAVGLLTALTVHIVGEHPTGMLATLYNPVGHQVVVGELYESAFGILIAHTDKVQVAAVLC